MFCAGSGVSEALVFPPREEGGAIGASLAKTQPSQRLRKTFANRAFPNVDQPNLQRSISTDSEEGDTPPALSGPTTESPVVAMRIRLKARRRCG
jgi:hypothetical protein